MERRSAKDASLPPGPDWYRANTQLESGLGCSASASVTTFIYAAYGARAVLLRVTYDTAGLGQWVHQLQQRTAHNKGIVAIANKLARIAWAVLSKGK
jgi:transposase